MLSGIDCIGVGLAAVAAGMVNALAGGGTLITFPVLLAVGIPAVAANVTSTVALCPGYLSATFSQAKDLRGQARRVWLALPAAAIGGLLGGLLLLHTSEKVFRTAVPFLILLASGLLALQGPLRNFLLRQTGHTGTGLECWAALPIGMAAVYGGYFGAGVSVVVLAVLGLMMDDSLTRLNALKQAIAFSINIAAACLFVFSGQVQWWIVLIMTIGSLIGGTLGGRLAGRIKPAILRWIVVTIGLTVGIIYLVRA